MTYTFPLTLDEAAHLLNQSVEERGAEFVYIPEGGKYSQCLYWHPKEDKPGCGVGDALFKAGVPAEKLIEADAAIAEEPDQDGSEISTNSVLRPYLDVEARAYMRRFQANQDENVSWGEALEHAEDLREKIIEMHP